MEIRTATVLLITVYMRLSYASYEYSTESYIHSVTTTDHPEGKIIFHAWITYSHDLHWMYNWLQKNDWIVEVPWVDSGESIYILWKCRNFPHFLIFQFGTPIYHNMNKIWMSMNFQPVKLIYCNARAVFDVR